jgi:hypothetical protein
VQVGYGRYPAVAGRGDQRAHLADHLPGARGAREIGGAWDEACALAGLGQCALAAGRTTSAITSLRQAQEIFRRIGAAEATEVTAELSALAKARPPAHAR